MLSVILVGSVVRKGGGFRTVRGAGREGKDEGGQRCLTVWLAPKRQGVGKILRSQSAQGAKGKQ